MQHATRATVEGGVLPRGGAALLRASWVLKKVRMQNDDQRTGVITGNGCKARVSCSEMIDATGKRCGTRQRHGWRISYGEPAHVGRHSLVIDFLDAQSRKRDR